MELEEVGAVKIPKTLRAKVVPAVNMKLEIKAAKELLYSIYKSRNSKGLLHST